jgi:hypothetical protein
VLENLEVGASYECILDIYKKTFCGFLPWVSCLVLNCYRIHRSKETKDYSQEGFKEKKKIAMDFILEGLLDPVKVKVRQCSSTKEL